MKIFIFFFGCCLMPAVAGAEGGRTGAAVLQAMVGARAAGMGQAFTAVSGDLQGILYNPAGAAFITGSQASASYLRGYGGDGFGLAAFSSGIGPVRVSPAILYYNSGKMQLNLSDGTKEEVTGEEDNVGMLGLAVRLAGNIGVGALFKLSSFKLGGTASASGAHFDAGVLWSDPSGLGAGAAMQNYGSDIKFEEAEDPPPRTLRAGLSYKFFREPSYEEDRPPMRTTVSADWLSVYLDKSYYQAGVEFEMDYQALTLAARGGWMFERDVDNFTAGFGVKESAFTFDYAICGAKAMNVRHQFSLGFHF